MWGMHLIRTAVTLQTLWGINYLFWYLFLFSLIRSFSFHTFNLFSEDRQIECTINRLNKSCFAFFFCLSFLFVCGWGCLGYCWFLSPGGTGEACCCKRTQVQPCYLQFNLPTGGRIEVGEGGLSWLLVPEGAQRVQRWGWRWGGWLVSFPSIRLFNSRACWWVFLL